MLSHEILLIENIADARYDNLLQIASIAYQNVRPLWEILNTAHMHDVAM